MCICLQFTCVSFDCCFVVLATCRGISSPRAEVICWGWLMVFFSAWLHSTAGLCFASFEFYKCLLLMQWVLIIRYWPLYWKDTMGGKGGCTCVHILACMIEWINDVHFVLTIFCYRMLSYKYWYFRSRMGLSHKPHKVIWFRTTFSLTRYFAFQAN